MKHEAVLHINLKERFDGNVNGNKAHQRMMEDPSEFKIGLI